MIFRRRKPTGSSADAAPAVADDDALKREMREHIEATDQLLEQVELQWPEVIALAFANQTRLADNHLIDGLRATMGLPRGSATW